MVKKSYSLIETDNIDVHLTAGIVNAVHKKAHQATYSQ